MNTIINSRNTKGSLGEIFQEAVQTHLKGNVEKQFATKTKNTPSVINNSQELPIMSHNRPDIHPTSQSIWATNSQRGKNVHGKT